MNTAKAKDLSNKVTIFEGHIEDIELPETTPMTLYGTAMIFYTMVNAEILTREDPTSYKYISDALQFIQAILKKYGY